MSAYAPAVAQARPTATASVARIATATLAGYAMVGAHLKRRGTCGLMRRGPGRQRPVWRTTGEQHATSTRHQQFASNDENYRALDQLFERIRTEAHVPRNPIIDVDIVPSEELYDLERQRFLVTSAAAAAPAAAVAATAVAAAAAPAAAPATPGLAAPIAVAAAPQSAVGGAHLATPAAAVRDGRRETPVSASPARRPTRGAVIGAAAAAAGSATATPDIAARPQLVDTPDADAAALAAAPADMLVDVRVRAPPPPPPAQ